MRRLVFGVAVALALAGCEAVSSRVSDRFAAVPPQSQMYDAPAATVFQAAEIALKRLDFTVSSSAVAQGKLRAQSRVRPADSLGGARQFTFDVSVSGPERGPMEVTVLLRQDEEGDFRAGPTSQPLRQHGLYAAYFKALGDVLATQGFEAPVRPAR